MPLEEMQLCFDNFKSNYKEFDVLLELTLAILQSMDIIPLKGLTTNASNTAASNDVEA